MCSAVSRDTEGQSLQVSRQASGTRTRTGEALQPGALALGSGWQQQGAQETGPYQLKLGNMGRGLAEGAQMFPGPWRPAVGPA